MKSGLTLICLFFMTFSMQAQRLHSTANLELRDVRIQEAKTADLMEIPMLGNIAVDQLTDEFIDILMVFQPNVPYSTDSIVYVEIDREEQQSEEKRTVSDSLIGRKVEE